MADRFAERHITGCATEDLLCGRPHKSSTATRLLRPPVEEQQIERKILSANL
jgi:hypothetical protein